MTRDRCPWKSVTENDVPVRVMSGTTCCLSSKTQHLADGTEIIHAIFCTHVHNVAVCDGGHIIGECTDGHGVISVSKCTWSKIRARWRCFDKQFLEHRHSRYRVYVRHVLMHVVILSCKLVCHEIMAAAQYRRLFVFRIFVRNLSLWFP